MLWVLCTLLYGYGYGMDMKAEKLKLNKQVIPLRLKRIQFAFFYLRALASSCLKLIEDLQSVLNSLFMDHEYKMILFSYGYGLFT